MRLHLNMTFFLSAQHWVIMSGKKGEVHTHTWEIELKIFGKRLSGSDLEVGFTEVENIIRSYLAQFESMVLNDVQPFDTVMPSTENFGIYLANGLKGLLTQHGFGLEELTIRESPTRGVTISDINEEVLDEPAQIEVAATIDNQKHNWNDCKVSEIETDEETELDGETELDDERELSDGTKIEDIIAESTKSESNESESTKSESAKSESTKAEIDNAESRKAESDKAKIIVQENVSVGENPISKTSRKYLASALAALFLVNLLIYFPVLFSNSPFPWGIDTWGHAFKSEFLYKAILAGDLFPRFMSEWYNGIDPFRYYAPLPYYFLTGIRFLTGDVFTALNVLLFLLSFVSSCSWLLFRQRVGLTTSVIMGVLWAFSPYNIRVAFMEGNIPWFTSLTFLPVLIFLVLQIQDRNQAGNFYKGALIFTLNLIILSHAMVGAVFLVSLSLFLILVFAFGGTNLTRVFQTIGLFIIAVMVSAWWLLPSLTGGITALSQEAVKEALNYYSPLESLNPLLRLSNPETFYLGLSYLVLAIIAIRRWQYRAPYQKAGLILGLGIFLLTMPVAKPFYQYMPLSHLLWPVRFVPVGIACMLIGCLEPINVRKFLMVHQNRLKKSLIAALLILVVLADSLISMVWIKTRDYPAEFVKEASEALDSKGFKVAVLDHGKLGSFPTYFLSENNGFGQIYGWAYQGAVTSQNVMLINLALEKGWYDYLFDRLIEMGATHLIVLDELVKEKNRFFEAAEQASFELNGKWKDVSFYSKAVGTYLVTADYKILGIGRHVSNMALVFPEIEIGKNPELDKYSIEELSKYETLFLSGFSWVSKLAAENLILDYVEQGGRVVLDLTGSPRDVLSNRVSFLGVFAEPVIIGNSPLISVGQKNIRLTGLPEEYLPWKTYVLEGVDEVSSLVNYYDQKRPIAGYKVFRNQNIYFLGLNLPFYCFLTKDQAVINMLSNLLQTKQGKIVPRQIVEIEPADSSYRLIKMRLPEEVKGKRLLLPLTYLDSMDIGMIGEAQVKTESLHNLVSFIGREGEYEMRIENNWPSQTKTGALVSLAGLLLGVGTMGNSLVNKLRQSKTTSAMTVLPFLMCISFTMLFPQAAESAPNIVMDGEFTEWEGQAYLDDPQGDIMNVSDQTETSGDTRRLYWGTNPNEANLYFSIIRYPSNVKTTQKHKMTGKIFFDINGNGIYDDEGIDRVGYFQYNPSSGQVRMRVLKREPQNNSPVWETIGKYGERKNEGLQFEFYYPFEALGVTTGQAIRFYATTSFIKNDNPKSDDDWVLDPEFDDFELYKHDFDLIPDAGDIQYSPVPALGYLLFGLFLMIALIGGVLVIQKGKVDLNGTGS